MRAVIAVVSVALLLAACQPAAAPAAGSPAAPTRASTGSPPAATSAPTAPGSAITDLGAPLCTAPAQPTSAQAEGPYFTPGSPVRTSLLEPGIAGTVVVVSGYVLTRSCRPIADAVLDFWQADASGVYDNSGFRLRGRQRTDSQGRYRLETVIPGEYPGRTPHIHVKLEAPGMRMLTSQLYLPDATRNAADPIFRPELAVRLDRTLTPAAARFDFVADVP